MIPDPEVDGELPLGEFQCRGINGDFLLYLMDPVAVKKSLVGELLVQENRLLAALRDREFDGPEPSFLVLCRDRELLSLGNVLGKRFKSRRGRVPLIHKSDEPSHEAEEAQENDEADQ